MATTKDAQFYRTRKMATFIPVVGVPFMAAMFWLGDGGKGAVASGAAPVQAGINMDLPKAGTSTITSSKLAAYAAPVDSLRNRDLVNGKVDTTKAGGLAYGVATSGQPATASSDAAVLAAQKQLATVQAAQQSSGQVAPGGVSALSPEQQMELMRAQHLRELDEARTQASLERINAQSMATASAGGSAVTVSKPAVVKKKPTTRALMVDEDAIVSHLGSNGTGKKRTASFQGLDDGSTSGMGANTLAAVIHESQEVVSGSLVKMRLTDAAVVNGHRLAANTFIYGKCALAGERLTITIETLKSGNNIFPASLEVYDVDGLEGLHIPGAITRDASKQAGADAMGAADMMTMSGDPTTAAAGVAVNAVKSLGQKKIRLVKVRLKAGYNIMLKVDKD
ncbi:conjugative transposon protein TraM [Hymenobacter sp. BRD67]|uniref:conjugative transposon protein TraM n=1 Tax=Hymenobacter sp. BRD67 TaxID=2675877 RepID=UPI0015641CEC|nr:conjugative transposon protein TraM [Hymenobacter sp. BRD67]QKG54915.1 conjugative transposon protein TraM [Hymenobacter sp. BRD67]